MPTASGLTTRGPRNLLRQIREAMAGGGPAQERLDLVVRIIAQTMVAEVCSIYLRRASGELELFATQGLNREAVHNTRLSPGEGLVGEVARVAEPISLSHAPSHPNFSYRPETGEDPYHAFLGAPLLRGGRAIGVLVVQNQSARRYDEDEIEDIQTIAMVLAETVASGELMGLDELRDVEVAPHRPERFKGQKFSEGLAFGHVVLHEAPCRPRSCWPTTPRSRKSGCGPVWKRSRPISTPCWTAVRACPAPRSRCWKPTACSPSTGAGTARWKRPSARV